MTLNLSNADSRTPYFTAGSLAVTKNPIPDFEKSISEKIQLTYRKIAQLNENLRKAELQANNLDHLHSSYSQQIHQTDLLTRIEKCQELTSKKSETPQQEKKTFEKNCLSFLKQAEQSLKENGSIKLFKCKQESLHSLRSIESEQAMTEQTLKRVSTEYKKSTSLKFLEETVEKFQLLVLDYSLQLLNISGEQEVIKKSLLMAFSRSSDKWIKFNTKDFSRYEDLTPEESQEINQSIQENPNDLKEILISNNIGLVDPSVKKIFRFF